MALRILEHIPGMPDGYVVAVVGNTAEHARTLCALVVTLAEENGICVDHVTLKPVGADKLGAE